MTITKTSARDKMLALVAEQGWVLDPTARISRAFSNQSRQDPYTFIRAAAHGGQWRIHLSYHVDGPSDTRQTKQKKESRTMKKILVAAGIGAAPMAGPCAKVLAITPPCSPRQPHGITAPSTTTSSGTSDARPQAQGQINDRGFFMDEVAFGRYRLIEVISEGGMRKVYYDQGGRADAQAAQRENAVGA
jgi:hypothetical protein